MEAQNINDLLQKYKIKKINSLDDLKGYFDIDELDDDSSPIIKCQKITIIIFDNERFEETYIIDLINKYLDKNTVENIEFCYIDDFDIKRKILLPEISETKKYDKHEFELRYLHPAIMKIIPKENNIFIIRETFAPFSYNDIKNIIDNDG
jgi:hypothetical protein